MNCPNCNSEMVQRLIAEVMIDECDNCGVLWFDKDELEVYRKKYYTKEIDKDVLFNQFIIFKEIERRGCPKCSSDKFMINKLIQDGVLTQLEIIGEATKRLSKEITDRYPKIPWKDIAGMRDKLIHGYFGVDLDEIWLTVKKDIPELKKNIQEIVNE